MSRIVEPWVFGFLCKTKTHFLCSARPVQQKDSRREKKGGDASPPPVACKFLQTTSTPLCTQQLKHHLPIYDGPVIIVKFSSTAMKRAAKTLLWSFNYHENGRQSTIMAQTHRAGRVDTKTWSWTLSGCCYNKNVLNYWTWVKMFACVTVVRHKKTTTKKKINTLS